MLKGDELRAAIHAAGYTQKSFAAELSKRVHRISQPSIHEWLDRGVPCFWVHHVADLLDVDWRRLQPDMVPEAEATR